MISKSNQNFSVVLVLIILLVIILMGGWLRFRDLDRSSFWLDEILSVSVAKKSIAEIYSAVPNNKPPLDYYLLHFSISKTENEFTARFPAAIFGTLNIGLIALFTFLIFEKFKFRSELVILSALLIAFNAYQLRFSQEARLYMHSLFWILLFHICFLRILAQSKFHIKDWGLLFGSALGAILTSYFSLISFSLCLVFLLIKAIVPFIKGQKEDWSVQRNNLLFFFLLLLFVLILCTPLFIKIFKPTNDLTTYTYDLANLMDYIKYTAILSFGYHSGNYLKIFGEVPAVVLLFPIILIGMIQILRLYFWIGLYLILHSLVHCLIVFIFYWLIDHWMASRYLILGTAPIPIFLATGCWFVGESICKLFQIPQEAAHYARLARTPSVAVALISFIWISSNPSERTNWRGLAEYLNNHQTENSSVYTFNDTDPFCLNYYLERIDSNLKINSIENWRDLELLDEQNEKFYLVSNQAIKNEQLEFFLHSLHYPIPSFNNLLVWHNLDFPTRMQFEEFRNVAVDFFQSDPVYIFGMNALGITGAGFGSVDFTDDEPFCWIDQKECVVYFYLDQAVNFILTLELIPVEEQKTQSVEYLINDQPGGYFELLPDWNNYQIEMDKEILRSGINKIVLRFDNLKQLDQQATQIPKAAVARCGSISFKKIQ